MSKIEINFLDTTVFKVDNKQQTKMYVKMFRQTKLFTQQIRTF